MARRPRIDTIRRAVARKHIEINDQRLGEICQASAVHRLRSLMFDSKYRAVDLETWKLILKRSQIDKYRYRSDIKDCDNFVAALFGTIPLEYGVNTVGLVIDYSGRHAYNALVYYDTDITDLKIALVEPQSDEFVTTDDRLSSHEAYKAQRGMILWG